MKFSSRGASRWVIPLSLILAATFILVSTLSSAGPPPAGEGESVYKAKCAVCHAADGSGGTPMGKKMKLRDLASPEVQKQSDAQLAEIIGKGKSPMPGYEKQLDKEKIQQLVSYIRELGKKH
jgi:cytochrome c6